MKIFPALDLKEGKCVRLLKGNFNKITIYNNDPIFQVDYFEEKGFKNLHLVDLDGSLGNNSVNKKIIKKIIRYSKLDIQFGGGIRTYPEVDYWVSEGVKKIVLGSVFFTNFKEYQKICKKFRKYIAFPLDIKKNFLAFHGWKKTKNFLLQDLLLKLEDTKISRIIFTNIDRDGMRKGTDLNYAEKIVNKTQIPLMLSGGISSLDEVIKIKKLKKYEGIVIGKSLYENKINIDHLIRLQNGNQ